MNALTTTEPEGRQLTASQRFRAELSAMGDQFAAALPSHIKPEKFQRVVMTAVIADPKILNADRKSLMEAAIRAAQDGLLPDKREGAFVVFRTKEKVKDEQGKERDRWFDAVQWMPMIAGIIKKLHQSGEVSLITAKVVFGGDTFRAWVDDAGEHVAYEQCEHPDFDTIRQVFAMARTRDGTVYVETLTPRDVDKIRSVSRSNDRGPWVDWWEEMAKKSAIRRLAKRLPLSTEVHDLIQRDDALYDLSRAPDPRPSFSDRLRLARQEPTDAPQTREGFDREHVTREAAALAGGASEAESEDSDAGGEPDLFGEQSADDSDDAPEADQAADGEGDGEQVEQSAVPSPVGLTDADREWLRTAAKMLWGATAYNGDPSIVINAAESVPGSDSASEFAREKAKSITKRCTAVCRGEIEPKDARAEIAAMVGLEPAQVGGLPS